ncbi:MAG: glycosyltransferase family 4 protein [Candidatus Latescibacteria bacterium]|nr:glycosyltransferase family 4 protein [Candidatus Latescibacterota bacterium]
MNILHTIYDDFNNPWCGGGGALRTMEISRRLSDQHQITILSGAYPNAPKEENVDGVQIRRLGSDSSYLQSRMSFAYHASREIARTKTDLWVHQFSAYAPLYVSAKRRQKGLLEFFHLMGEHATEKYPLLGHIARHAEHRALRQHPHILTISPTATHQLEKKGVDAKFHLVYTGVDQICFEAPWGEEDYILYFGRLDTINKGIDVLISAFAKLDAPSIRLVLAGRGTPERQSELQSIADELNIGNRIEFTGPVTPEQKNNLIGNALFVCMPSRYEGWGIVAVEASAASKAVIGTDIPGLADAIRPNETGLLVPSENPEALASAMEQLLADAQLRKRLGEAGRKWAERFTWDRIAKDQERVYLEVVNA